MAESCIRSADKPNGPKRGPRTEEELRWMLLNGSSYLINLDWGTLSPAEISPGEGYEDGTTGNSSSWDVSENHSDEPWDVQLPWSSYLEGVTQAYVFSDAAEHVEALLSATGVEPIIGTQDGGKSPRNLERQSLEPEGGEEEEQQEGTLFETASRGDSSANTWSGSTVASGRESSVESDLLSISTPSDADLFESTTLDDELSPVADRIARRLLDCFQRTTTPLPQNGCPLDGGLHNGPGGTPHNESSPHQQSTNHTSTDPVKPASYGKGLDRGHDKDEDSDDEGSRRRQPRKLPGRVGERRSGSVLACPFWKLDPSEHRRCLRVTMKDTSRVKQHLSRKHATDFYCERCMAVFPDSVTHQTHIQAAQSCRPRSHSFTNITHQQQRQLSRKSKPGLSEMERWFAIWDIVFPGQPRPTSPYLDANMSEDLSRFREFAEARGPAMIAAEIHGKGTEVPSSWTEKQAASALEQTISRGVTLLFDVWLAERSSGPALQKPSPSSHPSLSETSEIQANENPSPAGPRAEEIPATSTPFPNNSTTALDNIHQEGRTEFFDASCGVFTEGDFSNWQQQYPGETVTGMQGGTAGIDELVVHDSANTSGLLWEFGGLFW